jgi:hypothetical protein
VSDLVTCERFGHLSAFLVNHVALCTYAATFLESL